MALLAVAATLVFALSDGEEAGDGAVVEEAAATESSVAALAVQRHGVEVTDRLVLPALRWAAEEEVGTAIEDGDVQVSRVGGSRDSTGS